MDRRLLPYEYQLIEALGVSKEEYLEFVALQQEYKDPKAGTELDVRNGPAAGTVALVLTIVGTLFQVGAALLAPKPKIPDLGSDNERRTRQQRFSPSSGFNSAPELASYGDPVNLIYTSKQDNPRGGVRASGSLVWSSIDNYGSAQFMQLLLVLGAAQIIAINHKRTAFGSLAIDSLDPTATFLFFKRDKNQGRGPLFSSVQGLAGAANLSFYPEALKRSSNEEVCQVVTYDALRGTPGFSQAYSPTTSSSIGIYDPIPVNVDMLTRDSEGVKVSAHNGISLERLDWKHPGFQYVKGAEIVVKFESTGYRGVSALNPKDKSEEAALLAISLRRQAVNALDFGGTYLLGSAKFRLVSFGSSKDIEGGDVNATFRCIEDGFCPSAPYNEKLPLKEQSEEEAEAKQRLEAHLNVLKNVHKRNEVIPKKPKKGDKNLIDNQYVETAITSNFVLGSCSAIYDFKTLRIATWTDELGTDRSRSIDPSGSLDLTIAREARDSDNPPVINSNNNKRRKDLKRDIRRARQTIDEIQNGDYDESNVSIPVLGNKSLFKTIKDNRVNDKRLKNLNAELDQVYSELRNIKGRIDPNLKKSARLKNDAFVGGSSETLKFGAISDLTNNKTGGFSVRETSQNLEQRVDQIRGRIQGRRNVIASKARGPLIRQLEGKSTSGKESFKSFPYDEKDKTYRKYDNGGIDVMQDELENFPKGNKIEDINGIAAIEEVYELIKAEKQHAKRDIKHFLNNWEDCVKGIDNNFFVKALVKADSASYETMSEVDQVKFSIKAKLFRRISGRQEEYAGTPASDKYSAADNGIHGRQVFFRFSYKKELDNDYTVHRVLFSLRQASESDAYSDFNFFAPSRGRYSFKIEPVYDVVAERALNNQDTFVILNSKEEEFSRGNRGDKGYVWYKGKQSSNIIELLGERGPKLVNEWDVFSVDTDTQIQFSLENGPELLLTAVTEQQIQSTKNAYLDFSVLGLSMFAGRNVQDLRNVTAFVEEGKRSYKVNNFDRLSAESTSYAPDIFVDTVLDKENGIGKYAPPAVLDQDSLKLAKRFCINNNLPVHPEEGSDTPKRIHMFMDCVIADNLSWREFWVSNAPFSLLEFARKNGKETLVPVFPTDASGKAAENDGRPISLTISALFTTGNILEDSYKEEFLDYGASTQDLIASIVYREESSKAVFQRKRTVQVERKNTSETKAIRETFDASGFITGRQQAIMFGKMLVNQRNFIRRGIEFKTFPTSNPIEPGAFIYVDIGLNSWDRSSSGVIAEGGVLNSPLQDKIKDGTYSFLLYNQNDKKVDARSSISVSGGVASSLRDRAKDLYVMGIDSGKKRVFRITEVEMDQDGEVTVRAIEYPCDDEQRAKVADFRPTLFKVS